MVGRFDKSMQQIKHTYKDYDIYIVWHDNVVSKMDGYAPWAEVFICYKDLVISDENHRWRYYEKFDTDRVRWDGINSEYLFSYSENLVDRVLEMF
jgi:hypothetical protein